MAEIPEQKADKPLSEMGSEIDARQHAIATVAYLRAEARGFSPGGELEDWLEAEKIIDEVRENS